jgi:hypothetical protein
MWTRETTDRSLSFTIIKYLKNLGKELVYAYTIFSQVINRNYLKA